MGFITDLLNCFTSKLNLKRWRDIDNAQNFPPFGVFVHDD